MVPQLKSTGRKITNWALIKTQYEILGQGVLELSKRHNIDAQLIENAVVAQHWQQLEVVVDDSIDEAIASTSNSMQIKHEADLIPRYIEVETLFMDRLKYMVDKFTEPDEAKKLAETLAIIKPAIMKQADNKADKVSEGAGANRVTIVNAFPVPQPGDTDFVAPNAVLLGEHARKHNGITTDVDYATVEYDTPDDLN